MHEHNLAPSQQTTISLSFLEWVWAYLALACFWNKRFKAPYPGLSERKAMILMHLRGEERPAEEVPVIEPVAEIEEESDHAFEPEDFEPEGCGHDECREIAARLKFISENYSYADYEDALYTLGYCAPRHAGEADYGDMPEGAGKWIDARTMPFTAQTWRWQQEEKKRARQAEIENEQCAELAEEMKEDRHRDNVILKLWEELTAEAKNRPLSEDELEDVRICEQYFGGHEETRTQRAQFPHNYD